MRTRTRIGLALLLALLALAAVSSVASARAVSPWVGRWQTIDVLDGSTNTLQINFRGDAHRFGLIWRETYFTLCDGAPGIGRGTAVEDLTGFHSTMEFFCAGTSAGTFGIEFVYRPFDDTIVSDEGTPGEQVWVRISPRPW